MGSSLRVGVVIYTSVAALLVAIIIGAGIVPATLHSTSLSHFMGGDNSTQPYLFWKAVGEEALRIRTAEDDATQQAALSAIESQESMMRAVGLCAARLLADRVNGAMETSTVSNKNNTNSPSGPAAVAPVSQPTHSKIVETPLSVNDSATWSLNASPQCTSLFGNPYVSAYWLTLAPGEQDINLLHNALLSTTFLPERKTGSCIAGRSNQVKRERRDPAELAAAAPTPRGPWMGTMSLSRCEDIIEVEVGAVNNVAQEEREANVALFAMITNLEELIQTEGAPTYQPVGVEPYTQAAQLHSQRQFTVTAEALQYLSTRLEATTVHVDAQLTNPAGYLFFILLCTVAACGVSYIIHENLVAAMNHVFGLPALTLMEFFNRDGLDLPEETEPTSPIRGGKDKSPKGRSHRYAYEDSQYLDDDELMDGESYGQLVDDGEANNENGGDDSDDASPPMGGGFGGSDSSDGGFDAPERSTIANAEEIRFSCGIDAPEETVVVGIRYIPPPRTATNVLDTSVLESALRFLALDVMAEATKRECGSKTQQLDESGQLLVSFQDTRNTPGGEAAVKAALRLHRFIGTKAPRNVNPSSFIMCISGESVAEDGVAVTSHGSDNQTQSASGVPIDTVSAMLGMVANHLQDQDLESSGMEGALQQQPLTIAHHGSGIVVSSGPAWDAATTLKLNGLPIAKATLKPLKKRKVPLITISELVLAGTSPVSPSMPSALSNTQETLLTQYAAKIHSVLDRASTTTGDSAVCDVELNEIVEDLNAIVNDAESGCSEKDLERRAIHAIVTKHMTWLRFHLVRWKDHYLSLNDGTSEGTASGAGTPSSTRVSPAPLDASRPSSVVPPFYLRHNSWERFTESEMFVTGKEDDPVDHGGKAQAAVALPQLSDTDKLNEDLAKALEVKRAKAEEKERKRAEKEAKRREEAAQEPPQPAGGNLFAMLAEDEPEDDGGDDGGFALFNFVPVGDDSEEEEEVTEEPYAFVDTRGNHWRRSERALGKGAFGKVFVGMGESGAMVAIKGIPILKVDEHECHLAIREVTLLTRLRHENIVEYVGGAIVENYLMVVMEAMGGGSLHFVMCQYAKLSEPWIKRYLRDILAGLRYLHSNGILHRDIKPHNVLLTNDGRCKLADFGTAAFLGSQTLQKGDVGGTPIYMAPEACLGQANTHSDVWSVGIMAYQLATGEVPWHRGDSQNPHVILHKLGKDPDFKPTLDGLDAGPLKDFIQLCLHVDSDQRPSADMLLRHPYLSE